MSKRERFQPKSLPFDQWPGAHQAAWRDARRKGDLFGEGGGGANWRAHSALKTQKGYGVWLQWNIWRGVNIYIMAAQALVTREAVIAYVADLQATNASMTVACRIQELYDAIRVMASPRSDDESWRWLRNAMKNLRGEAYPAKNKRERLQTADRIEHLGLSLMAQAESAPSKYRGGGLTELQRALMYRDGLMIALLIRRPLRLGNFCALKLHETLRIEKNRVTITLPSDQTKSHRPIEAPFPDHLVTSLRRYTDHYRPILLTASGKGMRIVTDRLWISRDGTELAEISLHNAIRRRTKAAFGAPVPPHWFRDASVTTLVHDAPESARLTTGLLGHGTPGIAEQHYNQALMIDSARKYAACMKALRDEASPEDRGPAHDFG